MEIKIITGSVTYAVKCKDVLISKGYKATIVRNASEITSGCGYAVKTVGEREAIRKILIENNVKFTKIQ